VPEPETQEQHPSESAAHRHAFGANVAKRQRQQRQQHTYATRLSLVRAIQELMGHSRSDMTLEIYTSSVPEVLRDAADSLDSLSQTTRGL
jgi:integrase